MPSTGETVIANTVDLIPEAPPGPPNRPLGDAILPTKLGTTRANGGHRERRRPTKEVGNGGGDAGPELASACPVDVSMSTRRRAPNRER